jgi:hypothetical protein
MHKFWILEVRFFVLLVYVSFLCSKVSKLLGRVLLWVACEDVKLLVYTGWSVTLRNSQTL